MQDDAAFWDHIDALVDSSDIVIDRPAGSAHPRYPARIYPLDYGYLAGTSAIDGGGIDVWVGSDPARRPTAIVCSVDLLKRDAELKILLGCTPAEQATVLAFLNGASMRALLIPRP